MKDNRNTLLFIGGIGYIIKSIICMIALILVALSIEMIDTSLKLKMFTSDFYADSPKLGEAFMSFTIIAIFVYLSLTMFLSFATGLVCIDQSKLESEPLTNRTAIVVMSLVNAILLNGIIFAILNLVALIVDKNQPGGVKEGIDENTKTKIEELKKLKEDKVISQKEFIEMLTKLLVE
jgi:hypothetical protein